MKSHKELINITNTLGISYDMEPYFNFAKNNLINMKRKGITDNKSFFDTIMFCQNNPRNSTFKTALGKLGRHSDNSIKNWCKIILNSKVLRELSIDELLYIMGCGSRISKIKSNTNL